MVLGTGEERYARFFRSLQEKFPDYVSVKIMYHDGLAYQVEAGADLFLMPSRYEPCELNRIYSLKYGTVPVVRATGGPAVADRRLVHSMELNKSCSGRRAVRLEPLS